MTGHPRTYSNSLVAQSSREYRWRTGFCKPYAPLLERFERLWMPVPFSGCWIWTGNVQKIHLASGEIYYGTYRSVETGRKGAHQVAWELYRGAIPEGLQVNHKCDVSLCVNPDHLYLGTQAQNLKDCRDRGRTRVRLSPSHCPHGHEYTAENSIRKPSDGRLRCRACYNAARKKWRARHAIGIA